MTPSQHRRLDPFGFAVLSAVGFRLAVRCRPTRADRRAAAAAFTAVAGPAAVVSWSVVRAHGRCCVRWPRTLAGRLMLGVHVLSGVVIEEVWWRGPVAILGTGPIGRRFAPASAAGFLALHLRRDGWRSLPVHLTVTLAWTGSALLDRRLRWGLAAHSAYNLVALGLQPRPEISPRTVGEPPNEVTT